MCARYWEAECPRWIVRLEIILPPLVRSVGKCCPICHRVPATSSMLDPVRRPLSSRTSFSPVPSPPQEDTRVSPYWTGATSSLIVVKVHALCLPAISSINWRFEA